MPVNDNAQNSMLAPIMSSLDWFLKYGNSPQIDRTSCILKSIIQAQPLPAGAKVDFPFDMLVEDEKDYVAYTIPNCKFVPNRTIVGESLEIGPGKERSVNGEACGEIEADPCHVVCLGRMAD